VTATGTGPGTLNISWSFTTPNERIPVNFTLVVNGFIESGIEEKYYIFTAESNTSCDIYNFQVQAVNPAGMSDPSEIQSTNVSSLPNISALEDSLRHYLTQGSNGIMLTIAFQVWNSHS